MTDVFEKMVQSILAAGQIDLKARCKQETEEEVFRLILGFSADFAKPEDIIELFGESYFPGTFAIGEIDRHSEFLCQETNIGYDPWVRREIRRDIEVMRQVSGLIVDSSLISNVEDDVLQLLCHEVMGNKRLCDLIALQEYTDIFRRLILALLLGNPELEVNTYRELNEVGGAISLAILPKLDNLRLHELLKMSLAAGLIGLNLKTSASATSKIHQSGIIPLSLHECIDQQLARVYEQLQRKTQEEMAIDYWEDYEKHVLQTQPKNLVVFTDDYIETIFDLKLVERQLYHNPNLTVCVIPRARRYGNDASYEDVVRLLEEPVFRTLKLQNSQGRLKVSPDGPRLGTVNGLRISQGVADQLKRCDALFVKGARAYEMLQGVGKPAYFGFAVCREISEAVTGINAETGALVFIRQHPFQRTFSGFRMRRSRPHEFRTGRRSFLCQITSRDLYEEDLLPSFYHNLCKDGYDALRERTVQTDRFLDDLDRDLRRGLTLIVRPSYQVTRQLVAINERLRALAPRHFYYDALRFHFTIISLITACEAFDLDRIPLELYERTIREVLIAFPPFVVEFIGVGPTRNSVIAKGFPMGGISEAIRDALRDRLRAAGLGRGVDERYRSRGAHITLGRLKVVEDFSPMIACLEELCSARLGRMRVQQAQLVVNDFYMSPDKVKVISEIALVAK